MLDVKKITLDCKFVRFARTPFKWLFISLIVAEVSAASALQLKIVSLAANGTLVWTNNQTNIYCGIQYAPALGQPWTALTPPFWNIFSTAFTNSAVLPFSKYQARKPQLFFRMLVSTNILPGLQTYNVDSNGIPIIVRSNYIELAKVSNISRFRSGDGHDYSDDFEHCRSMKHYFIIDPSVDATAVRIFSPITGYIYSELQEGLTNSGTRVQITSTNYPAFLFILFHVNVASNLTVGMPVTEGQQIGTHIGDPASDIAVWVYTPTGAKLLSYFDVMPDSIFQTYQNRGITNRAEMIITKAERDADPLDCNGETFLNSGNIPNNVNLSPPP